MAVVKYKTSAKERAYRRKYDSSPQRKAWRKDYETKRCKQRLESGYFRKLNDEMRKKVFIKLGDKCAWCGFSDPRALQIDHVNNDGYEERKKSKSANHYMRMKRVLTDTNGRYQILCANCNFIKKYEFMKKKWRGV